MGMFGRKKTKETTPEAVASAAGKTTGETTTDPKTTGNAGGKENAPGARGRGPANPTSSSSVMNPHMFFEGNIRYEGILTIDCEVKGGITTEDTLIVGPSAKVQAEITAGNVEIAGKVYGNIRARNSVKIVSGGEVHGNIETPSISMEEGVVFEGKCSRPQPQPQPQARPRGVTPRPGVQVRPHGQTTTSSSTQTAHGTPQGTPGTKTEQKTETKTETKGDTKPASSQEQQKPVEVKA